MPIQLPFQLPAFLGLLSPLHDFNVQGEAVNRLIQQYKGTNFEGLINALAAPAQDLEDALNQLYISRWINSSTADQLDVLGSIVGQARNGLTDDAYRPFIQTRILVNRSSGGPEELYSILALVLPPGVSQSLLYQPPACFLMTLGGVAITITLALLFAGLLRDSRAAGVGGQLVWSTLPPSGTFTLDGTSGQALDHGGLAEASN